VDCAFVFELPEGDERRLGTVDALEMEYRDRATSGVAGHGAIGTGAGRAPGGTSV